jgi:hypothetical protein
MQSLSRLRRGRRWLALLLPFLLVRGLIPVGFMPMGGSAGLIGLCPGAAAMPPGMVMPQHADHHGGGETGTDGAGHAVCCPFALSATVAGAPALLHPLLADTVIGPAIERGFLSLHLPAILRAQSSRGPPRL